VSVRTRLRSFLRALFRRSRVEREMDAEIQFHLDERTQDLVARGMRPPAARRRAREEFGDALRWKEDAREVRGVGLIDGLRADLLSGLRWLVRSPGLAVTAILSMAIGIGANTAIFSVVNVVLLERMAVHDPRALVLLGLADERDGAMRGTTFPYPFYLQLRSSAAFSGVIASAPMSPALDAGGAPERMSGELVSGNYFELLGVLPYLGRHFTQDDDRPGANQVAVLSYGSWMRRFGGDPNVIGRVVRLNDFPIAIVGVSPRSFHGLEVGSGVEIRVPITLQAEMHAARARLESRGWWWLQIVARVKSGVTGAQVTDTLDREFFAFRATLAASENPARAKVVALDGSRGDPTHGERYAMPLTVLSGLVAIVLALVCVNVGNLLMARATARQMEMSVRLSMGASRLRIVRQLLVETIVLAGAAGSLGLLASRVAVRLLASLAGAPADFDFAVDGRVLAFTVVATGLTGLVCGLAPAWASTRIDILTALRTETGQHTRVRSTTRRALIAGQIALSLALLAGAGLFARTLFNLRHAPFGFDVSRLGVLTLNPALAGYGPERRPGFYAAVLERVSALPAVESAAFAVIPLLDGNEWGSGLTLDTGERDEQSGPLRNAVGPGFFRTVGIPLLEGREFGPADTASSQHVAVVNEAFVRRYLRGASAIGRRVGPAGPRGSAGFTVVGVTRDTKTTRVREMPHPFWYVPYAQVEGLDELSLHVRADGPPDAVLRDVQQAIAAIDPRVAVSRARTMHALIEDQVEIERLLATLAGVFAVLALFLASLGLYSTVSYLTTARTREIGVRMALGASPSGILRLVIAANVPTLAAGSLAGLALTLIVSEQVRPLLFGLEPRDPSTIAAATVVVALMTTAAAALPARRAAAMNPGSILK
jgi:predicted permease